MYTRTFSQITGSLARYQFVAATSIDDGVAGGGGSGGGKGVGDVYVK